MATPSGVNASAVAIVVAVLATAVSARADTPETVPSPAEAPTTTPPAPASEPKLVPCPPPLTQAELEHRKDWVARRQHSTSMKRWGDRLLFIGAGAVIGGLLGSVTSRGSITVDDRSIIFYAAIGTLAVPIPFYIVGYASDPGAYHPLQSPTSISSAMTKVVSTTWTF